MVSFYKVFIASLAIVAPIAADLAPAQVVVNIKTLTQKSYNLQAPAQTVSLLNFAAFPQIAAGFTDIVATATVAITAMQGMSKVPAGQPSDLIFEAFRDFVRVHQALLNILIGKAGLFTIVPIIGQPIATVLREVEKIVDTIAFGLIDAVQGRGPQIQEQRMMLKSSIQVCAKRYEGVSLSSSKRSLRFAPRDIAVAA